MSASRLARDGFSEPRGPSRKVVPLAVALGAAALMYAIDAAALRFAPVSAAVYVANFAVPFDLMVCVPLVFCLLFVRGRRITPIAVLPVIYAGGAVSALVAVPGAPSILPVLFGAAFAVDAAVLVREIPRLARAFRAGYREGRKAGAYPAEWFARAFEAVIPNRTAARVAATELAMWYHLVLSRRRAAVVPKGREAFSYHRKSGFLALVGVVIALGVVEIVAVHLLVSRYSVVAAVALTAASLYGLAWLGAFARSVVACPILIGEGKLTAAWGFLPGVDLPVASIERVAFADPGFEKGDVLDLATMGATPCWVILREAVEVRGTTGRVRNVRAIRLSPDEPDAFARSVARFVEEGGGDKKVSALF